MASTIAKDAKVNEMPSTKVNEMATIAKSELSDYEGGEITENTTKIIGKWIKILIPLEGGFNCMIQPVMKATWDENDDSGMAKLWLDFEGAHSMQYTPWKLVNKTKDAKIWIHDDALIADRNRKEEAWKVEMSQKTDGEQKPIESSSDGSFEHANAGGE